MDFADSADHRVKIKENEKRDKKKTMKHEEGGDTNCDWRTWNATSKDW